MSFVKLWLYSGRYAAEASSDDESIDVAHSDDESEQEDGFDTPEAIKKRQRVYDEAMYVFYLGGAHVFLW